MPLLRTVEGSDIQTGETEYAGTRAEADGVFLAKGLYGDAQIKMAQREILSLLQVMLGGSPETTDESVENFHDRSQDMMTRILAARPEMRKGVVNALRKLPGVQALVINEGLADLLRWTGMTLPLVRLQSLQVFLPWERLFHEQEHQDYGGMISESSWTIQVPLQAVDPDTTGSAEIYPGTYRHGPLMHHLGEVTDGYFHEVVEDRYFAGIEPARFAMDVGDAVFFRCLNIHRTVSKHSKIRWSMILRFDEAIGSDLVTKGISEPADQDYREYEWETWSKQMKVFFDSYSVPSRFLK